MPAFLATTTSKFRALAIAGLALTATPLLAEPDMMYFDQAFPANDGPDVGVSEIVVVSNAGTRYDAVQTAAVDVWLLLQLKQPQGERPIETVEISGEGTTLVPEGANLTRKVFKFSFPYADPHSLTVVNQRNSPIAMCNERLERLTGAARQEFARKGTDFFLQRAYPIRARGTARWMTTTGRLFKELHFHERNYDEMVEARVRVVCKPLTLPQRTTGAPKRTPSAPFINTASLRIEPAQIETVGGQLCPSQLRLYGQVQANRAFNGKAVIFGPGYLSPVTALTFPHGGNRNFSATYPLKWDKMGGLAAAGPEPIESQTISLTMNVTSPTNYLMKQVKETVTVTCKAIAVVNPVKLPVAVAPPAANQGDPDRPVIAGRMTVGEEPRPVRIQRTNPIAFFVPRGSAAVLVAGVDTGIRLVDRKGPNGATRLFVRNGGQQEATGCKVHAKRDGHDKWILIESMSTPIAPGATTQLAAGLPSDPALRFAVDCKGEPDNRLDNNVASLP
jgi:hypothetical protein